MHGATLSRYAAGFIAVVAWLGLFIQCTSTFQTNHSVVLTLWIVFAYFTILTNLLVAVVFTAVAAGRTRLRAGWVVAGTMLAIVLVGVVYGLLLHGTMELSGGSAVANVLNHMATPILVPIFWIVFTPKGQLRWLHPLVWAMYPLAYLGYSLIRGGQTGQYPYPFLDPLRIGWQQTMLSALAIAVAFFVCGYAVVALDYWMARRATPGRESS